MGPFINNQLFDLFHITYIVLSLLITIVLLVIAKKFIKQQKHKDVFLKFWGLITFLLHISTLWPTFLRGEDAIAADNMLFPIYYCNVAMLLLMITAFVSNKSSKGFKHLAIITAYAGTLGALISLFYPEYYVSGSGIDYPLLKSLLSHSTMLVGSLYLMTGNYFKIEIKNAATYALSFLGFGLIGAIVNLIFEAAGLYAPNAMYLQHPPIDEVRFLNAYVIAALMSLGVLGFTKIYTIITSRHFDDSKQLHKSKI